MFMSVVDIPVICLLHCSEAVSRSLITDDLSAWPCITKRRKPLLVLIADLSERAMDVTLGVS